MDKKDIKIVDSDANAPDTPDDSIASESHKKIEVTDFAESNEKELKTEELVDEAPDDTTIDNATEESNDLPESTVEETEVAELGSTNPEEPETPLDQSIADDTDVNFTDDSLDPNITVGEAIDETKSESDFFESNPEIDAAVDDIVRTESDEVIAETDAKLAALQVKKDKKSIRSRIKGGFRAWWDNRPARYGVIAGLIVLFAFVVLLPGTRYVVLNFLGVRASSSMIVVDSQTRLPLKNITVQLQEKTANTDEEGKVSFIDLKLGNSKLAITKRGYANNEKEIVLGWGSNPIGEQQLVATGEQFTFVLSDWRSDVPITSAEAVSGENSAKADEKGKIVLTVGEENISNVEITITALGYRTEKYTRDSIVDTETKVAMVPAKKHVFVSNRNGEYDLYVIDVDAKNEKVLLASTGKEREIPVVIPHPNKDVTAYVSSRDGEQNKDGYIVDGLFIIDTVSGESERIARSEQLQVIGWSGDRVIFLQVVEGTSQGNDERSKLISYNYVSKERTDLAASNYFNDVELVDSTLYYAVSSFAVPESQAKLFSIDVDGQNKVNVVDAQVWNIFRTSYDTLLFSAVNQKWFKLVGDNPVEALSEQPAPLALDFADSPDGKRTVWVEVRDGKGVLLKSATNELKEEQVLSLPGLSDVLYWVDNATIVFRVISTDETADYVLNLDGGEMQKITDVTATRNPYF